MSRTEDKYTPIEQEVAERARDMEQSFLVCRDYGHAWEEYEASEMRKPFFGWRRSLKCLRCDTERHELVNVLGDVGQRRYIYPEGYQLKGLGIRGGMPRRSFRRERHLRTRRKARL